MNFEERDFFKDEFTEKELRELIGDTSPLDIFSWRSPSARSANELDREKVSKDELIRLMVEQPRLIRRPLIYTGDRLFAGTDKAWRWRRHSPATICDKSKKPDTMSGFLIFDGKFTLPHLNLPPRAPGFKHRSNNFHGMARAFKANHRLAALIDRSDEVFNDQRMPIGTDGQGIC